MQKKAYKKPETEMVQVGAHAILGTLSTLPKSTFKPQNEQELEEAGLQRDSEGFLWGD